MITEKKKKAYRYLLYQAMVMAKGPLGKVSKSIFTDKHERSYMKNISALNSWLHNLALFNYTNNWEEFDEELFWKHYEGWHGNNPNYSSFFKDWFNEELNR